MLESAWRTSRLLATTPGAVVVDPPPERTPEMSMTTDRISQIQLVLVPSADQDRSVAFYEALGFKKRNDIPRGDGYRWV